VRREIARLERENKRLRTEKEILTKFAAFVDEKGRS
jgi:transposase-like protein